TIDNKYLPLVPRTRFTYTGSVQKAPVVDIVTVTRSTPTIDGVKTVEVRDQVFESNVLTEDTLDWYAQDDAGNVWYFGELATQLPAGTHHGSLRRGVRCRPRSSTSRTTRAPNRCPAGRARRRRSRRAARPSRRDRPEARRRRACPGPARRPPRTIRRVCVGNAR